MRFLTCYNEKGDLIRISQSKKPLDRIENTYRVPETRSKNTKKKT